jgi:hypothetical protein
MGHGMAADVGGISSPSVSLFYTTDGQAVSWVKVGPLYGPHDFEWKWYSPSGDLYNTYAMTTDDPQASGKERFDSWMAYSYMSILGNDAEYMPGDWRVDVYMDGKYLLTEKFSILPAYGDYSPYDDYRDSSVIVDAPQGGWDEWGSMQGEAI